ncbi:EmrB/QacA subfamily drug resistance transporter [Pseudosporangium ferrugineum]|uniref:EmrB/QacA subfamily drug resistance transporter n=2 Tax=Pseudosporangium ferrugineum TaxID=439699 RepID=A0A2T0S287_9ACTN|nr:EmrB/QacA subfamily drug resistance transporter [Pseudosporangium ferrugineum]
MRASGWEIRAGRIDRRGMQRHSSGRESWWPLVTVCLGTFMLLVDVTIVNVALPQMATGLHTSFTALQWVIDGYALSLGVLLLGAGALGDRYGHRRLYAAGLVLFALASLACGLATGTGALIAARVLQGVGAAAMFTTTFALLNTAYRGRSRGVAYGVWGGVSGASAAAGPILGGLLTEAFDWRWIFLVNLPVSVAALALCATVLKPGHEARHGRFDLAGTVTFTVAATALTVAVIRAGAEGWGSARTWGLLLLSVLALAAFGLVERRSPAPMFDLSLLRNRSFAGILVAALLVNFGAFAAFTYTSIWLQSLLGMSPLRAGLTGLPMSIVSVIVSGVAGARLHGRSPRLIIGGGMLLIGAGGVLLALMVDAHASWPALIAGYAVTGAGVGLVMPALAEAAMGSVPPQRGGMAAGAVNTARQLGFAIGIAILGTVFASQAERHLAEAGSGLATDPAGLATDPGGLVTGPGGPAADLGGVAADPGGVAHGLAAGQAGGILHAVPEAARSAVDAALRGAAAAGLDAGFLVAAAAGLAGGIAALALIRRPAAAPTASPAAAPTGLPAAAPTASPAAAPTGLPAAAPTGLPAAVPTGSPAAVPTGEDVPAEAGSPG